MSRGFLKPHRAESRGHGDEGKLVADSPCPIAHRKGEGIKSRKAGGIEVGGPSAGADLKHYSS